jgi:hypothetical protein
MNRAAFRHGGNDHENSRAMITFSAGSICTVELHSFNFTGNKNTEMLQDVAQSIQDQGPRDINDCP